MPAFDAPPPAAAAALLDTMDGLSRGLNHALSNRINTLNTLLAVLQESRELDPEIEEAFQGEEQRFGALLKLYRLMPLDRSADDEPMVLVDPVNDALALFSHHLDLRMLPCRVQGLQSAPPVRCRRQCLTQALLVLLVAVGRAFRGEENANGLVLAITADDDTVTLRGVPVEPAGPVDETAWQALQWLATCVGASATRGTDEAGHAWAAMTLPTLAATRKKGR